MGGKNPGGRQSALEQLYLAYRQDVYRYLCSLTRNASDAEDLLSETFLRALKRLPFFPRGLFRQDLAVRHCPQRLAGKPAQAAAAAGSGRFDRLVSGG